MKKEIKSQKIVNEIINNTLFYDMILVICIFFGFFYVIQFQVEYPIDYDSYWHIKSAEMIKNNGFIQEFPWAINTILSQNYSDNQLLYRILLIPFTFSDPLNGSKLSSVIFSAFLCAITYWFLRKNKVKYASIWISIALVSTSEFLFRLQLSRAMPISIAFMILSIYFIQKNKHIFVGIISFLHIWLYTDFIFIPLILMTFLSVEFIKTKNLSKPTIKTFKTISLSMIAGIIIHPYFPKNIGFLYNQIYNIGLHPFSKNAEWQAATQLEFLTQLSMILILITIALYFLLIQIYSKQKFKKNNLIKFKNNTFKRIFDKLSLNNIPTKHIIFLVLSIFFLILSLKAKRMMPYFVIFSIIYSALVLNKKVSDLITKYSKSKIFKAILIILMMLLISIPGYFNIKQTLERFNQDSKHNFALKDSAEWLKYNTENNSIVFIINGIFSPMFYFNDAHNKFTTGIDENYIYYYNQEIHAIYFAVLNGDPNTYFYLKSVFNAEYVHLVKKSTGQIGLFNFITKNPGLFEKEYEDSEALIYRIK